jgi:hypothetical protein
MIFQVFLLKTLIFCFHKFTLSPFL